MVGRVRAAQGARGHATGQGPAVHHGGLAGPADLAHEDLGDQAHEEDQEDQDFKDQKPVLFMYCIVVIYLSYWTD